MEHPKVKSVSKQIEPRGARLSKTVLKTMKTIADIVGATLGPGGQQVLIERYEHAMPPMVTKDGVTVFRSLGFTDAAQHCIMEAARDAAVRTATEAGDGTTTATILSEAIVRHTNEYCTKNRNARPQKVVRRLEQLFRELIEPAINGTRDEYGIAIPGTGLSIHVDSTTPEGQALLRNVALVSANGDEKLADAVMECFDLVGDDGNVTITESSGPSGYAVEKIDGFPIPVGYEDSCAKFYTKFINDPGTQMCRLDNPVFVLYHGTVNDIATCYNLLSKVGDQYELKLQGAQEEGQEYNHHNVVFVAIGFSEQVLATFAAGFGQANSIKIFPLVVPKSAMQNFQTQFLEDVSVITGATVFDPINKPLDKGDLEDLGPGVQSFEASRFRSTILGNAASLGVTYETAHLDHLARIQTQLERAESHYDRILLQERLGKVSGGIARLRVVGASNGELKEKRDRAEDAVCAVRGAIKHGCLPGGGWTLIKVVSLLNEAYGADPIVTHILKPALMEPFFRLMTNCGKSEHEIQEVLAPILTGIRDGKVIVFDAMRDVHGDPVTMGILDSTPAVVEAVRNSISIASLLGTLGGTVVFARDADLERAEGIAAADWMRQANTNEADERA